MKHLYSYRYEYNIGMLVRQNLKKRGYGYGWGTVALKFWSITNCHLSHWGDQTNKLWHTTKINILYLSLQIKR